MELRLSGFEDLNRERGSELAIEFPDSELEAAMGSLFDINVAMEKKGFVPASKGGRVNATATLDAMLVSCKED
jgi:hypothetical protein